MHYHLVDQGWGATTAALAIAGTIILLVKIFNDDLLNVLKVADICSSQDFS